jgi:hypothetical protein
VLIAGYGRVGEILGGTLSALNIPFLAFDRSPDIIERKHHKQGKVFVGDVSRPELLRLAHADRAAAIVLTMDQPQDILRALEIDPQPIARHTDLRTRPRSQSRCRTARRRRHRNQSRKRWRLACSSQAWCSANLASPKNRAPECSTSNVACAAIAINCAKRLTASKKTRKMRGSRVAN